MRVKMLGIAALAVVLLGATTASSALAHNEFSESESSGWYTGASPGTKLPEGSNKTITTEAAGKLHLESSGPKFINLLIPRVDCSGCVIKNVGTKAVEEGVLQFKEVTLSEPEPANCGVTGTIETKKLKGTVGMKGGSATIATVKFAPESGTTIATIELLGAKCSVAGVYNLTGTIFAEMSNATYVFAKTQGLEFSVTTEQGAGEAESLKFGERTAWLTGKLNQATELEYAAKGPTETNQYLESGSAWYTGSSPGTKLAEGTTKALTKKAATKVGLETSLFKVDANGASCSACVIKNVGANAIEEGALQFNEATVSRPAGCSVPGTIETKKLKGTVGMRKFFPTTATVKYVSESGTLLLLEISGASCPVAGLYKITGTVFGEFANLTGGFSGTQKIKLGQAVQESAGSASSLTFGGSPLFFTGDINNSVEVEYAAKEK